MGHVVKAFKSTLWKATPTNLAKDRYMGWHFDIKGHWRMHLCLKGPRLLNLFFFLVRVNYYTYLNRELKTAAVEINSKEPSLFLPHPFISTTTITTQPRITNITMDRAPGSLLSSKISCNHYKNQTEMKQKNCEENTITSLKRMIKVKISKCYITDHGPTAHKS